MYCRGPLPDGHPADGVTYFCVDHDIATGACNLLFAPPVHALRKVSGLCVLLDAHRAPNAWFAIACNIPQLIIQGDPDAHRPRACTAFADELEKCPCPLPGPRLHMQYANRLADAIPMALGRYIVLVGAYSSVPSVYSHLRPNGVQRGDIVQDMHGRSGQVDTVSSGHVFVDQGRRAITRVEARQQLVMSPGGILAGEYDTVIVMPDGAQPIVTRVCRRCRYMIIGIRHSPMGYV